MPDTSPILQLPYILPAQAQKHVTHNEAIRVLDVIVQLAVTARNLAAPPVSPPEGARYIVAAAASGAWVGKVGQIALFDGGLWQFFVPLAGWTAWVVAEQKQISYNGSIWTSLADAPFSVGQLGISATPDSTNRLSVSAPATLLNHAGAGHQFKLNKALSADTASLLFQTGFSGRAEIGTAGSDDFAIKVSADGSSFVTGLSIASATGQVTLAAAARLGGQAVDPVAPPNGTIWLNSTSGEVKMRSGGATVVIATGGAGVSDGDKGDITVSASGAAWVIDAGAVGNSKLASMASGTFKARVSAGVGAPQDISPADAAGLLPAFTSAAKGLTPASGGGTANYLRADGTWAAPPGSVTLASLGITATAAELNQLDVITLGTASAADTGTGVGNVPVLGAGGVLAPAQVGLSNAGAAPLFACRAWVNFNGTGVVAIRASGNVSSITDNGVVDYTVNFTTAMADANYAAVGMAGTTSLTLVVSPHTYAAASLRIVTSGVSAGAVQSATRLDHSFVNIAIFR